MNRTIIDVPLPFARYTSVSWRPDWRGQPAATGTDGSEQVVFNAFPRWVGSQPMILLPEMIGHWRALVSRGRGRVNAYRMRMTDPALLPHLRGPALAEFEAWQAGLYTEPRPQVPTVATATAGATTITVDERLAPRPIAVGAILSYDDWPFLVEARSGSGIATVLTVALLRTDIPEGGQIDLIARGVFVATSDAMGWPEYGVDRVAYPQLDLQEWITR